MMSRTHLTKRYPQSKAIKDALLKGNGKFHKPAVCEHNQVDYKSMAIITKRATRVIENLAKAVVSLEDKNNQMGDTLISFLNTAEQMMSKQDKEIVELRKRLEVMRHVN